MPLLGKKHEPSWNNNGLKLISMAYSLLYLTVLTPGGLALLAFLTGQGVSAEKLSFFVAAGVVAGGAGVKAYTFLPTPYMSASLLTIAGVSLSMAAVHFVKGVSEIKQGSKDETIGQEWLDNFMYVVRPTSLVVLETKPTPQFQNTAAHAGLPSSWLSLGFMALTSV